MVSGIPTASGYEERIRFSEMEVVDSGPNEQGLVQNVPQGHEINGWDVNVAGVRTTSIKRHVRHHTHAVSGNPVSTHISKLIVVQEFLIRVKQAGRPEIYVGRRYGEFVKLHKKLRIELPGKVLPPLPRKNKSHAFYSGRGDDDDDAESISSASTQDTGHHENGGLTPQSASSGGGLRGYLPSWGGGHRRSASRSSPVPSPRASLDASSAAAFRPSSESRDASQTPQVLYREEQRVSLRAFIRNFLQNERIAQSQAMAEFLTGNPVRLNEEEMEDVQRRKEMDEKRIEEQKRFYEVARQRAKELDVHMEKFRREVVESSESFPC